MFPKGEQMRKYCFPGGLAMFLRDGQTGKHCFSNKNHKTKMFVVEHFWHVLKGETSKRNDRNETAETTETTETKRPKRNSRNEMTETKRPKRNDRNETAENINYRKNGKY
jgi:hypothetical protein